MVKDKEVAFTVTSTGVGRKDYSLNVEFSVEPIVRSYQNSYIFDEVYTLTPSQVRTIDIPVTSGQVVLLYDFICSCLMNVLLGFEVQSVDADGTVNSIFSKSGYQRIEHRHDRGAPVYHTIRIILTNRSLLSLSSVAVTLAGIYMTTEEYYMELTS